MNFFIALIAAAGIGTWVYNKAARRLGGSNPHSALVAAGVVGLIVLIIVLTLLSALDDFLKR